MTITAKTDVYAEHGTAYTYLDNRGESTWTGKYFVITAIETHGDGIKITTSTVHGFEIADSVTVVETTNHNVTKPVVTVTDTTSFTIDSTYVADETSGYVGTEANIKAQEVALRKATEWIDNHPDHKNNWKGNIASISQLLSHPRSGLYDEEGRTIGSTTIALGVEKACIEMANRIIEDTEDIFPDISAGASNLKRRKIDVIEKEWFSASSANLRKIYDKPNQLLAGLLKNSGDVKTISRGY